MENKRRGSQPSAKGLADYFTGPLARRPSVQHPGACAGSRLKRDFRSPAPSLAVFCLMARRSFSGSPVGGIAETQEILNFCGANNITTDVEVIPIQKSTKLMTGCFRPT